jgi:hypothetical protein
VVTPQVDVGLKFLEEGQALHQIIRQIRGVVGTVAILAGTGSQAAGIDCIPKVQDKVRLPRLAQSQHGVQGAWVGLRAMCT